MDSLFVGRPDTGTRLVSRTVSFDVR